MQQVCVHGNRRIGRAVMCSGTADVHGEYEVPIKLDTARREALSCFVHDVLSNQSDEVEAGDRPRRVGVAGTAADCQMTVESERGSRTPRKLLPSCAASTRTAITGTQVVETARCSSPTVSMASVLVVAAPKACGPSRSSTEEQLRSRRATLSTCLAHRPPRAIEYLAWIWITESLPCDV